MTTTRSQEEIREDMWANDRELATLRGRERELVAELGAAKVRDAVKHEWLGREVMQPGGPYARARYGVLAMNERPHGLYVAGRSVSPGEIYVRSLSGKTQYPWNDGKRWELRK